MSRTSVFVAAVLAAANIQLALAQTTRKSVPDPAEWVPAEALAYLGVTDTARMWKDFQKTAGYKMMTDEGSTAAGVWGQGVERLKERVAQMLDVTPEALKNPFAGPLALYVTVPPGGALDDAEGVLIAGVGEPDVMQGYFDAVIGRLKEAAGTYETVSAGGETIHVFTSKKEDEEGEGPEDEFDFENEPSPFGMSPQEVQKWVDGALDKLFSLENLPEKLAVCLTEDRLVVAGTAEHIRAVLARAGGRENLAATADHQALLKNLKPVGQVRFLVNLPRILELARGAEGAEDAFHEAMRAIGAGSLRSVVGHLRMGTRSYDSKFELLFLMSGERTGLARLLSMENIEVAPPAWVSADSLGFASFNLEPPKLVDEILQMVQSEPAVAGMIQMFLENGPPGPEGQPMSWRKDLIDHLAGPFVLAASCTRPPAAGSLRGMLSLQHRNRDAVSRIVTAATALFGAGPPPRDFRGTQILSGPQGGSIAVTESQILYGNQAAVEGALTASATARLADDASFKRAVRYVPKEAWGVVYIDWPKVIDVATELAKKKDELSPNGAEIGFLTMLEGLGMDLSDAAQSRKLREYSAASIMTAATMPDGVRFTMVGLKPSQE